MDSEKFGKLEQKFPVAVLIREALPIQLSLDLIQIVFGYSTPFHLFHEECKSANIDNIVDTISRFAFSPADISVYSDKALEIVCGRGNVRIAKWLVTKIHPLHRAAAWRGAFREACKKGNRHVCEWLITEFGITTPQMWDSCEYFAQACVNGHNSVAALLLEFKPSADVLAGIIRSYKSTPMKVQMVDREMIFEGTLLSKICQIGAGPIIELLLAHIPWSLEEWSLAALEACVARHDHITLRLLGKGNWQREDVNFLMLPFAAACARGDSDLVSAMMEANPIILEYAIEMFVDTVAYWEIGQLSSVPFVQLLSPLLFRYKDREIFSQDLKGCSPREAKLWEWLCASYNKLKHLPVAEKKE